MSPTQTMSPALLSAQTLDEMLKAVPLLGECDTLEAVAPLAGYDRRADGWLTTAISLLAVTLWSAGVMMLVFWGLALAGEWLDHALGPSADEVMAGLGGILLRLLILALLVTITVLFFKSMGPRRWLVDSTSLFRRRVELRLLLLRAIQSHLDRNRRMIDNYWRGAVCQNCLARYERHWVRFAYGRWLSFARCRKCHSDHACYTHARRIQGWLDQAMGESQKQAGDAVRVNMLHRLPPRSLSLPTDLDELVVADVEDEDVETLIFLYRTKQPQTELPRPKRLRCRLTGNSTVSTMGRRQLKRNFWLVNAAVSGARLDSGVR